MDLTLVGQVISHLSLRVILKKIKRDLVYTSDILTQARECLLAMIKGAGSGRSTMEELTALGTMETGFRRLTKE